jgi:peptidoglycan/xylan/chitin deacetylase (PgdA/CDA1 family)
MSENLPGALVVSLDFELHWGMRDVARPGGAVTENLVESRSVVSRLAKVFADREIHATWATVGMLFASSRRELETYMPEVRPTYSRPGLDPYAEAIGADEEADPIHLAGSLVDLIATTPCQELGSHTFSHYYCLEPGQTEAALAADLTAAKAIAAAKGVTLKSIVLPRNQWNPDYNRTLSECGFVCYRGPQPSWSHQARADGSSSLLRRAGRLADTYAGVRPPPTFSWESVAGADGLCNVPASAFLRPYTDRLSALVPLQEARIRSGMRVAARTSRIFHLWWHPHNFAERPSESFAALERFLDDFARFSDSEGMVSMSMGDAAAASLSA